MNLESLFLHIQSNLSMSRTQIENLIVLTEKYPKLFNTSELIKINRAMSYLSFVFKDIKEYVTKKTEDGVFYEEIRFVKRRIKALREQILMK